jgi:hypothetical protein
MVQSMADAGNVQLRNPAIPTILIAFPNRRSATDVRQQ